VKTIHGPEYCGEGKILFAPLKTARDGVLSDFHGQPEKSAKNEMLDRANGWRDPAVA
jgi:hypothetical protein